MFYAVPLHLPEKVNGLTSGLTTIPQLSYGYYARTMSLYVKDPLWQFPLIIVAIVMARESPSSRGRSGTHQLMFLATGFCLFLRQFSNLLLYVPDLSLHPLVLILLPVFIANTLVSFLSHLLQVFLQPCYKRLEDEHGQMEKPKIRAHKKTETH